MLRCHSWFTSRCLAAASAITQQTVDGSCPWRVGFVYRFRAHAQACKRASTHELCLQGFIKFLQWNLERCAKWCNSSGLVFGLLFDECCRCFLNVLCLCVSFHHWMSMLACRGRTAGLQALPAGVAGEKSRLGPATGDGLAHAKRVLQRGTNRTTHRRPERDHGVAIQTQQFQSAGHNVATYIWTHGAPWPNCKNGDGRTHRLERRERRLN